MLWIFFRYSDRQIQCNRKLDGAEEEVNYCTDSASTNYVDTCEEKEYYEDNEFLPFVVK